MGVLEENSQADSSVFVPLSTVENKIAGTHYYNTINVAIERADEVILYKELIHDALKQYFGITAEDDVKRSVNTLQEILTIKWLQVDLAHGIFNIIDSKGKDRSVHMSESVREMMQHKAKGEPDELVFPGRENKISGQISQTFRQVANQLFNQGVDDRRERVTFHTLRHTCASWMVMQGISLYLVQKVLGHSTIQVTERYSHLAPDQLQLAANAINKSIMEHKEKKIIPFKQKA